MKPLSKALKPTIGNLDCAKLITLITKGQIRHKVHNELKQQVIVRTRYYNQIDRQIVDIIVPNRFAYVASFINRVLNETT